MKVLFQQRPRYAAFDAKRFSSYLIRVFEIVVALLALAATAPLMLALAIYIKAGSPGPALFVQKRVGKDGQLFNFIKFRTMYVDARERFPELYAYNYSREEQDTFKFKIVDDPRVTPQGAWLRKLTIDELPNFFNVLKGDMALVGPRPEIPEMLKYYEGASRRKFEVRPGVTGLAQVCGRGNLSFKDTVAYDLLYVRNRSFLFDLKIVLKTIIAVVVRRGAF